MTDLPKGATERQIGTAERYLLERAPTSNALQLRKLTKRVDDLVDPDGLLARERTAQKKCGLKDRDNHDGTHTVSWTTTDERHAKWKAAVGPLAAPRPAVNGTKDERTAAQRFDDAINDLLDRTLRFGDLRTTRGHRAHVIITITEENLRTGRGFGTTTSGETLTAEAVQRIACDANLHPLHIDGNGVPLKLGRTRRFASPAQWLALNRQRRRMRRTGLHPTTGMDPGPPPHLLGTHGPHRHRRPRPALRLPPRPGPPRRVGHPHGRGRPPRTHPTRHVDPYQRPIRNTHWHAQRGGRPPQRAA